MIHSWVANDHDDDDEASRYGPSFSVMATNHHHHHHHHHHQSKALPSDPQRRKKMTGEEKREALQREVALLQQMLQQEEKTHDFLEKVHDHHNNGDHHNASPGSNIPIPSFLNPKAKELVSELVAVENEIGRLESEISRLRHDLNQEKEITKESTKPSSRQWQNLHHHQLPPPTPVHHFHPNKPYSNTQDKLAFDTKALHFISKAIKGDYSLNHHDLSRDTTPNRLLQRFREPLLAPDRHDQQHQARKSGMLFSTKSPSPMRDFRNPSPWPRDRNLDNQATTKETTTTTTTTATTLPKALSNSILGDHHHQENGATPNVHHLQPNKLSENIMKCLNFIYVRLLRTSRAMELEKSGPISRSLNSSLVSRSFRADTGLLSSKSSSLSMYKESKQQDPYGIFDVEDSVPRDIGPYKNLVVFTSSSMDTKCISSSNSMPLIKKLRVLMNNLQTVDLRFLTHQQKLAFWINMYNACIMHGFIQFGVPHSPEKLLSLMNRATVNVGGNTINAQAIEHYILRKPGSSNTKTKDESKESTVRKLYGLESTDPNVTFALCCGTRSSPAVKVYTAEGVTAELERAKLEYLQASMVVTSTKQRVAMPELLVRNLADFAMDTDTLLEWVCHQLPTSGSLRKSIVDCFRGQNSGKLPAVTVDKIPYDSQFQYLLAV